MAFQEIDNLQRSRGLEACCPICADRPPLLPAVLDAQLPVVESGKLDAKLGPDGEPQLGGLTVAPRFCIYCGFVALFSLKALELHRQDFFQEALGEADPTSEIGD